MNIRCTHCGAAVAIEERTTRVTCGHCSAVLFVRMIDGVPQVMLERRVSPDQIDGILRRYLARMEIVESPVVREQILSWYPFWRLKTRRTGGNYLVAASTPVTDGLSELNEPAGAQQPLGTVPEAEALHHPDVTLEEAMCRAEGLGTAVDNPQTDPALVYLPIIRVTYEVRGVSCTGFVDGVSGTVHGEDVPPSPQRDRTRRLAGIGLVVVGVFLWQAWQLPLVWMPLTMSVSGTALYFGILRYLERMGW